MSSVELLFIFLMKLQTSCDFQRQS